jgi:hypothetical protein
MMIDPMTIAAAAEVLATEAVEAAATELIQEAISGLDYLPYADSYNSPIEVLDAAEGVGSGDALGGLDGDGQYAAFLDACGLSPEALKGASEVGADPNIGEVKLGDSTALRRNLDRAGIPAPEGVRAQANHTVPCQIMDRHPLGRMLTDQLGTDCVDAARNGEFLPENEVDRVAFSEETPMHRGSHPEYNRQVGEIGDLLMEDLSDVYGELEAVPADMADKVFDKWIELSKELSRSPGVQTAEGKLR